MTLRFALLMMMVVAPVWAAPALQVEQAGGKVLVKAVASKLAAWRPVKDGLVVVVPAESGGVELGDLPAGVKAEKVANNGLTGVFLQGVEGSWQVVQDGADWLVRPGTAGKNESLLMLRDGWRVGGETSKPRRFTVAGKSWDVALIGQGMGAAGSVNGAVRVAGKAEPEVAVQPAPKVIEAKMIEAKPVEVLPFLKRVDEPEVVETALPVKMATPVKIAQPKILAVADARPLAMRGEEDFSTIEPAAGREPLMEKPVELKKEVAAAAPVSVEDTKGLAKVVITQGPTMKALSVSPVADEILPQVLGEIYLPGTIVSLTLPGDVHGGLSSELPHAAEEVSATVKAAEDAAAVSATLAQVTVSRTWNQTTLKPIAAAMDEQKKAAEMPAPVEDAAAAPLPDEAPEMAVNRLFPVRGENYFDQVTDALQAVAAAPDGSTRARDAQMNLAQVYLVWQRPEEAMAVLDALPKRADGAPASPQGRLYAALAHIARGDDMTGKESVELLNLGGSLASHAKLWKAVAASRSGDYATALKMWPQERGILPQYPAYLRSLAQMGQATALVMVGKRDVALKVVDELVEGYKGEDVPVGLVRLQGLARLGTPDETQGLEYLAQAAEDLRDPEQAYRAKYEFVRALQQRKDLSDEQVLQYLSELWFDWRGDDLERDVLNTLASLYDKDGEPREALQHWQVLVKAFPKSTNLDEVTQRMTDAFLRVFDPENPQIYDVLSYVGLYYDFSELVPNDERGDVVQEQVARMLVNANLWDRAVPILEQQLEHRPLDPASQGRLALLLAEAYGNLGKAAEGIKILDKWQKVATTTVLSRSWKVEEAKLLLLLNRPQAANKALAALEKDDAEARDLRIEATWAAKDWSSSVPLLQDRLAQVPASQLVSDTGAQLAAFRLSYAYGQLQDGKDLESLSKRFESGLSRLPQLADDIGAVAAGTGVSASVVAAGPLAPLTTALNDINRLTDQVQGIRDTMQGQRKQQQEYNDKMRYMELLPPPAI